MHPLPKTGVEKSKRPHFVRMILSYLFRVELEYAGLLKKLEKTEMGKVKTAILDGANIAFEVRTKKGKARLANILSVRDALQELSYKTIIIADASLIHEIDDPEQMEALLDKQEIQQAPAGTDADYFILETADREDAYVISNDLFQPYQDQHSWIKERRIPYMIVNGEPQIYMPTLEDNG